MEVSSISNVKDDGSNDIESVIETGSLDCSAPKACNNEAKPLHQERREKRNRIGLFVFSAITGTLYAGAFFSWGPMQLLLEAHGVFEDRCEEGEATPCPAQTTRLLTVQFVAQFAIVLSPILGGIADHFGAVKLMYVSASCGMLGLGLLTLATGLLWDNLVFVAFFLVGVMAMSSAVNTVQVGLLFDAVTRQRVISALNTLFDAGLLTYLALWGIKQLVGCSLPALLLGYLAVGLVCFAGSIHYWRVAVPVDSIVKDNDTEESIDDVAAAPSDTIDEEDASGPLPDGVPLEPELDGDKLESQGQSIHVSKKDNNGVVDTELAATSGTKASTTNDSSVADIVVTHNDDEDDDDGGDDDYVLIADRSPMKQLQSKQFVTLTIFFALHATRDVFNLTTARDFLAYLGDDETGNKYLTIYTLLTPASILGLPVLDFVLTRYGYYAGLQTVNALALGQGIIMVSSDNLNVQVLGFVFASFFRCFMYTISLGILPTFLGINAVGKASGIMPCAAGILALVNIPLASWAVNGLDGNFFYPNLIYTLVVIPCIYAAWVLGQGIKREDAAKERLSRKSK